MDKLDLSKIEQLVAPLPYVMIPSEYAEVPSEGAAMVLFTRRLFAFPSPDTFERLELHALRCDCIWANLSCPFDDDNDTIKRIVEESSTSRVSELSKEDLLMNAHKCLFKAFYLRSILLRRTTRDDGDEDGTFEAPWCNTLLEDAYFCEEFVQLLRSFMVLNTLYERYAFVSH